MNTTLTINKQQVNRIRKAGENGIQILANIISRAHGYGKATEIKIGRNLKVSHSNWGFRTYSGKFFAGIRTTKYGWGGYYSPAETTVTLPMDIVKALFL